MMEPAEQLPGQSAGEEPEAAAAAGAAVEVDAAVLLLGAGVTAITHPLLYVKLLIQVATAASWRLHHGMKHPCCCPGVRLMSPQVPVDSPRGRRSPARYPALVCCFPGQCRRRRAEVSFWFRLNGRVKANILSVNDDIYN